MTLRVLDLFSGIGGFSLGLERAGMRTVAFCEIEPYCRAVLRKHWPDVPCFSDVRDLHAGDVGPVDVICGGFPCQDISLAGKGAGLAGDRSGLWSEYRRLIEECRPRYAIVENVSALRSRGLDQVLGGLSAIGYDAEWHCIPASAVGAPHRRDRIWIVAYAGSQQHEGAGASDCRTTAAGLPKTAVADAPVGADERGFAQPSQRPVAGGDEEGDGDGADTWRNPTERYRPCLGAIGERDWWLTEPDVGRVANGVPSRVDRLRALGNAVVPQIPEIIGRAIIAAEASQ